MNVVENLDVYTTPPPEFDPKHYTIPEISKKRWKVSSVALDISGSCNMACRYCAESASLPLRQPMTPEILDKAWNLLYTSAELPKHASFRLGSGEPMLSIHLLKRLDKLIKTSKNGGLYPDVFITTNGTLITDDYCDWLAYSGWHVKISLDGPKSVHDSWRIMPDGSGTFSIIEPIIKRLAKQMQDKFSVTAVLCSGTDPKQVFQAIENLGVKSIELVPVIHNNESLMAKAHDIKLYEIFVRDYAARFLNSKNIDIVSKLTRFTNKVRRAMGYNNCLVGCGAGRSFIAGSPQGDLYPCFRFIGLEKYKMGNLNSGIDEEAAYRFQEGPGRIYKKRDPCNHCWAAPLCGGPCFSCSELFGTNNGKPHIEHCAYALADARSAVWLVNELKKRDPFRLLSFLPGVVGTIL